MPGAAIARAYQRYLKLAMKLPLAEESTSYGTPSVKIKGKILSRWRTEAEGAVAIRCDLLDRELFLQTQPDVFFLTDHYLGYPMVLMRVERASVATLRDMLERAWAQVAPVRAVKEHAREKRSLKPRS
jgi:hypothetical protein